MEVVYVALGVVVLLVVLSVALMLIFGGADTAKNIIEAIRSALRIV